MAQNEADRISSIYDVASMEKEHERVKGIVTDTVNLIKKSNEEIRKIQSKMLDGKGEYSTLIKLEGEHRQALDDNTKATKALAINIAELKKIEDSLIQARKTDVKQTIDIANAHGKQGQAIKNTIRSKKELYSMYKSGTVTLKQYNAATFEVSQLLRELPSFAYGAQTGISSLSNNYPILLDRMKALRRAGMSNMQIFKMLGRSFFSLTNIVTIAVAAFVIFSDKIFKVGEAQRAAENSTKKYNSALKEAEQTARANAASEVSRLRVLEAVATDTAKAMDARINAIKELRKLAPQYLKDLSDEAILNNKAADAITAAADAIILKATAIAAEKKLAASSERVYDLLVLQGEQQTKLNKAKELYSALLAGDEKKVKSIAAELDKTDPLPLGATRQQRETETDTEFQARTQARVTTEKKRLLDIEKQLTEEQGKQTKFLTDARDLYAQAARILKDEGFKDGTFGAIKARIQEINKLLDNELPKSKRANELLLERAKLEKTLQTLSKKAGKDLLKVIDPNTLADLKRQLEGVNTQLQNTQLGTPLYRRLLGDKQDLENLISFYSQGGIITALFQPLEDPDAITSEFVNNQLKPILSGIKEELGKIDIAETDALADLENSYASGTKTFEQYEQEKTAITNKYATQRLKVEIKALKEILNNTGLTEEQRADYIKRVKELELELVKSTNQKKIEDDRRTARERIKIEEDEKRRRYEIISSFIQLASELAQTHYNTELESIDRKLNYLDEERDNLERNREIEIQKINITATSQQDAIEKIRKLEADTDAKRAEIEGKKAQERIRRARLEKQANVTEIISRTALAVVTALTEGDPYTKLARAAAAGVLGSYQLAIAQAAPIPQYEKGGIHKKKGAAIVGEKRSEIIVTPDGQTWITPDSPTLIPDMPAGSIVYPSIEDYVNKMPLLNSDGYNAMYKPDNMSNVASTFQSGMNELAKEYRNRPYQLVNITEKGFEYATVKANQKSKWLSNQFKR